MTYKRTDKEKVLERQAAELRNLELVEAVETEDLSRLAPRSVDGVTLESIHTHAYRADATVVLHAPNIQDALVTAERLNPVSLFRVKHGSLSFVPHNDTVDKQRADGAEVALVGPWAYKISGLRQHTEEHMLFFFVKSPVSDRLLRFEIMVQSDEETRRTYEVESYSGGVVINETYLKREPGRWTYQDKFGRGSNDQPHTFVVY